MILSPLLFKIISKINYIFVLIFALVKMIYSDNISNLFGNTYIENIIITQTLNMFGDVLFGYVVGMCIAKCNIITKLKN